MYFQKFDVENSDGKLYWHQYMQNVLAAQSEGATLKKTLTAIDGLDYSYTFVIPVYENMPKETTPRPNTTNTNIEVSTDLVKVNVTNSLRMRNEPNGSSTVGYLYKDEIATRIEKATTKVNGTYWDKILKSNGTVGYVARCTYDHESQYKEYLIALGSEKDNSEQLEVDDKNPANTDNESASNLDSNNSNKKELGDVNLDSIIDSKDAIEVLKASVDLVSVDKTRADVNKDGKISSEDAILILKYSVGLVTSF